jgi:Tfp pilus assembly protein PilN
MLEKYYRINRAAGISIRVLSNGKTTIHVSEIILEGSKLDFGKKAVNIIDLKKIGELLPVKTVVALNLSGKGVLQKQTEKIERIDQGNFNRVVPNANLEDFYIQNFISGEKSFVSMIRKSDADIWLEQLKELGFQVVMLTLGPYPVQNIVDQLNIYDQELRFDGNVIMRSENRDWSSVYFDEAVTAPFPLKIAEERIDEQLLIPFASAFQLALASSLESIKANASGPDTTYDELIEERKFKTKGFIVLLIFFVLLLTNFVTLTFLNSSNNQLQTQVDLTSQGNTDLEKLNEQIEQKETLLKNLGWVEGIHKSSLVDQLSSLLPEDLTLQSIAINPIDAEAGRVQRSLTFDDQKIVITGTSQKIIPVNEWIARIKTRPWVKNVQMESFTINNELNTGQFIIAINY